MEKETYQQVKEAARKLVPVSETAITAFEQSFAKIVTLVNEKFALRNKIYGYGDFLRAPVCGERYP